MHALAQHSAVISTNRVLNVVLVPNTWHRASSPTMTRLFSKRTSDSTNSIGWKNDDKSIRLTTLHSQLSSLGVDASELHESALQSIQDPSQGYDARFGKSAIKTYRAYLTSATPATTTSVDDDNIDLLRLQAVASRVARQVEFLIKRHKSSEAEWVRHLDENNNNQSTLASSKTTFPLILVLDNVRSALNVGSLFRTADATGCCLVITTGITPHPNGNGAEKLAKSALGAERVVPHLHVTTMIDALNYLREAKQGYTIIGMETTEKSKEYTTIAYPKDGCALILGNEVTGKAAPSHQRMYCCPYVLYALPSLFSSVSMYILFPRAFTGVDTEIMPLLDEIIEIPMHGAKNSLNIAACAPVVLYEILRQWNSGHGHESSKL